MRFSFRNKKSLLALFLVVGFFVVSALSASAGLFGGGGGMSIPSASSIMSDMEQRYHLNLGSIQNMSEELNVTNNKGVAPEVQFFFNPSDPKPGEKFSAKALPIFFSNTEETLYYTWYLKHVGCNVSPYDGDNPRPTGNILSDCDANGDGSITVEDWKTEAARILVQNGYDGPVGGADSDNDGYRAHFGGDTNVNTVQDYCYVHDNSSGINYEFSRNINEADFGCSAGSSPVCVTEDVGVTPNPSVDFTGSGSFLGLNSTTGICAISGYPTCSSGVSTCSVGLPRCVADSTPTSCGTVISECTSGTTSSSADPVCKHLFPNSNVDVTGNGSFGSGEEEFWGTNPQDPSTANNGNKDEANVAGLGQSTLTWNYVSGDQVGVAVEGTSTIPTKHSDSSYMMMWAFPKKGCPVTNTGAYTQSIRGYTVTIPAVDADEFDLNDCVEYSLVDPTKGGQATNLEVSVTATPDNPVNDETSDKGGDIVTALASASNAQHNITDMLFDWKVEISNSIQFNDFKDITKTLRDNGLLGNTHGNALSSIRVKLDMPSSITDDYVRDGIGYLRFKATVEENFSGGATRRGKSDVIVKFVSTTKKISAYKAGTELVLGARRAKLSDAIPICNVDALDKVACRVIKNEIIGLRINDDSGLSNFYWTVNGAPLTCSKKVSSVCDDTEQKNVNFFPVVGNPGDTYTVAVTANDVSTGNAVTLSRTFGVVAPKVAIKSLDVNVWPRLLGQYRDITGNTTACPDGLCNDYSTSMFETFPGSALGFSAEFIPGFLANIAAKEWSLDGENIAESTSVLGTISFAADKPTGGIYSIGLTAQVKQSDDTRRALLDIWGISPFDSPEINLSSAIQVQLQDPDPGLVLGPQSGPRKYFAAIVSYIPASVMFTFRIFLSAALVLFTLSLLYAFLEDRRTKTFEGSLSGRE